MKKNTSICDTRLRRSLPVPPSPWLSNLRITIGISICATALCGAVSAETVTDRFECAVETYTRSIELVHLDRAGEVPCEIRETREDGQTDVLWRANFDVSFCESRMTAHRKQLERYKWVCSDVVLTASAAKPEVATMSNPATAQNIEEAESTSRNSTATLSNGAVTGSLASISSADGSIVRIAPVNDSPVISSEIVATPSISATFIATDLEADLEADIAMDLARGLDASVESRLATTLLRESPSEVIFRENRYDADASQPNRPSPPSVPSGQLSSDELRQFDDWLIYLSALSVASIGHISDSESFDNFQLNESLGSDDIYSRLQNRIEYLQSLLEEK